MNPTDNKFSSSINKMMISLILSLLVIAFYWAKFTQFDLITRGEGRVIAQTENKSIQVVNAGTISKIHVKLGEEVTEGQVIATINPKEAEVTLDELLMREMSLKAKIARLESELEVESYNDLALKLSDVNSEIADAQLALFRANNVEFKSRLKGLARDLDRLEMEKRALVEEDEGLNRLEEILSIEAAEILPLVKSGALGSSEKYRLDREKASLTSKRKVLGANILKNDVAILEVENDIDILTKSSEQKILNELSDAIGQIAEVSSKIPLLRQNLAQTEIKVGQNGIINVLFFNMVGAVVKSGDIIAEIVPLDDNLIVEAYIDPKDIAKIEVGQNARISLTAFDASRYGYLDGKLIGVSADAVFREDQKVYMYQIKTRIDGNLVDKNGAPMVISPGMIAQVDVIRGQQSLIDYFWTPIAKVKDDAFRQ